MLRFGTFNENRPRQSPIRERFRLWGYFIGIGFVVWMIRVLGDPVVVNRIDAVFNPPTDQPAAVTDPKEIASVEEVFVETPQPDISNQRTEASKPSPLVGDVDLSHVKDNTFFRTEENPAWFAILAKLQNLSNAEWTSSSMGDVTYAQFLEQADNYRGQVVTIRGTAVREELLDAPENEIGLRQYHRLIIRPQGGGIWPIVVYALELPDKFPRGEIDAEVTVTGIFFKNWSYSWRGGLGLAPVILAKGVGWQPVVAPVRPALQISSKKVVGIVASSLTLAVVVGWLAWRNTRRSTVYNSHDVMISLPADGTEVRS